MQTIDSNTTATLHLVQTRQRTVTVSLGLCLLLAALTIFNLTALPAMGSAMLAASIYLAHSALDPARSGFLHHRRIRLAGVALTVAAAAAIALVTAYAAAAPLAFALAIAHHHNRAGIALNLEAAREVAALKQKILALETRMATDSVLALGDKRGDKRLKAG